LVFLSLGVCAGCLTDGTGVSRTSSLQVVTETTGSDVPPAYLLDVEDFPRIQIGPNDSFVLDAVPAGLVTVVLSISPNCQVEGENPRTVEIEPGVVTRTTFTVVCS
jgi:hypothetical protein